MTLYCSNTVVSAAGRGVVEIVSQLSDILTLQEAKDELGIIDTGDATIDTATDARLTALIATVQQFCEQAVYKTYGSATVRTISFGGWPAGGVVFDAPPLATVDSVDYVDDAGDPQTLPTDRYDVFTPSNARGYMVWTELFDSPELEAESRVVITYTSGSATVPPVVEQAAKVMLSRYWDDDREDKVLENYEMAAYRLLDGERWGAYA